MSTQEQEKIIQTLRSKLVKIELSDASKAHKKLDKQTLWVKAQEAGQTISDDALSHGHPSAA